MGDTEMIYNKERGTWNVFHNGEWYYEDKDYEKANEVYGYLVCPIDIEDYYGDDGDENYYPEEEYDYE